MAEDVSVVIPVRNGAAYLAAAIASVMDQGAAEIIVVDDGSEDESAALAASFGGVVQLHRQTRRGAAAARNAGIARASGAYLGFLDADDLWPPGSLACRLQCLREQPETAAAYGHMTHFYSGDLAAAERRRVHCPAGTDAVRMPGSLLFRRHVFDRIGGFDERLKIGEMFDFIAKFTDAGFTATCLPETVLARRIHATNLTRSGVPHRAYLLALKTVMDRRRQLIAAP